ncbi:hypothetical protein MTO96_051280 [Rhipicephalus appendiculatus]
MVSDADRRRVPTDADPALLDGLLVTGYDMRTPLTTVDACREAHAHNGSGTVTVTLQAPLGPRSTCVDEEEIGDLCNSHSGTSIVGLLEAPVFLDSQPA